MRCARQEPGIRCMNGALALSELQIGDGAWFGESSAVLRLGFGSLPINVRALATITQERSALFSELPSIQEQGLDSAACRRGPGCTRRTPVSCHRVVEALTRRPSTVDTTRSASASLSPRQATI